MELITEECLYEINRRKRELVEGNVDPLNSVRIETGTRSAHKQTLCGALSSVVGPEQHQVIASYCFAFLFANRGLYVCKTL